MPPLLTTTPPPPPPPGPCAALPALSTSASVPLAPFAVTVTPVSVASPVIITVPPAPPPPPPSFCGSTPMFPFALIVKVLVTPPTRIITIPPPVPPDESNPPPLLREPAPPPPPSTTCVADGVKLPPMPPSAMFEFHDLPPTPPAPPLPPPPPLPGAPRAVSPSDGYVSVTVEPVPFAYTSPGVPAVPSPLMPWAFFVSTFTQSPLPAVASPASARPWPPRNPAASATMVEPLPLMMFATSTGSTPPAVPFHASGASAPPTVGEVYWGTRITWKCALPPVV